MFTGLMLAALMLAACGSERTGMPGAAAPASAAPEVSATPEESAAPVPASTPILEVPAILGTSLLVTQITPRLVGEEFVWTTINIKPIRFFAITIQ